MSKHCKHAAHDTCVGHGRRKVKGFTLLELMIVVGIVALLAAIAMSSYGFANVKARRGAAKGCLEQASQYMERYYTTHFSYDHVDATATKAEADPADPATVCGDDVNKYYNVEFVSKDVSSYKIRAVPLSNQKDSKCGTLSIDQAGKKTPEKEGCW